MIVGIGVDVVDIERFRVSRERTIGLAERLLSKQERFHADGSPRSDASLAGRFAAKEALAKALGAPTGLAWHDAEVHIDDAGRPTFKLWGTVARTADALGVHHVHLSLTHDAGVAIAYVIAERR